MRSILLAFATAAIGAAVVPPAAGGGLDQSGQPVSLLFEEGRRAEILVGMAFPRGEGTSPDGMSSGNVYAPVSDIGFGLKADFGPRWSAALVVDQPYGVVIDYGPGTFPFAGTGAEATSFEITGLLRYRLDGRFSLHGGIRLERFGGEATLDGWAYGPLAGYNWTGDPGWGAGFVAGAAYEIPEIALRVALTYGSAIRHEIDGDENFFGPSTTPVTMPQSVNLDFRTGLDPRTLVYGQIRWVDWAGWTVAPQGLLAATGLPLVAFDSPAITYRLGLGRQLTPTIAGAVEIAHETAKDRTMTALDPYDGYTGIGVGAMWTRPSGVAIGGGVAYNLLGDAEVSAPSGASASFSGNHSLTARLRLSVPF